MTTAAPAASLRAPTTVVYADAALLVLDKPAGLLAVPGRGPEKQDCLTTRAQAQWADALVVHRLDMATSGLIVMARGAQAQQRLGRAFENRDVEKRYIALVHGQVPQPAGGWGEIDLPLTADWPNRPRQQVAREGGRTALTRYRVLLHDAETGFTRLELSPVTGRSHQLRVHLQALGHPIVGDPLYGGAAEAASPADRLMLHASHLALPHPDTGARVAWASPAPF